MDMSTNFIITFLFHPLPSVLLTIELESSKNKERENWWNRKKILLL